MDLCSWDSYYFYVTNFQISEVQYDPAERRENPFILKKTPYNGYKNTLLKSIHATRKSTGYYLPNTEFHWNIHV